jgi:hypothetical protein
MAEVDIPKRVVVVLLFLVILVSFLGTLTVLQLYATSPRLDTADTTKGTIGIRLLSPWKDAAPIPQSDDSSTVSVKINKYEG